MHIVIPMAMTLIVVRIIAKGSKERYQDKFLSFLPPHQSKDTIGKEERSKVHKGIKREERQCIPL
jgi:hypothetical protein